MRLSKGNAASNSSASISADAVAEHARQVAPLLPGGLSVVGLYLFAPGGLATSGSSALSAWREAVRNSAGSGVGCGGGCRRITGSSFSGILLGADASSRGRISAKEVVSSSPSSFSSSSSSSSLRHAEIRFAPLFPKLVSLRATYPVAAKVADVLKKKKKDKSNSAAPLSEWLAAVAEAEAARARKCVALGARTRLFPLDLSATVADSLTEFGEPESSSSAGAREVVLLPPAVSCSLADKYSDADGESDESGSDESDGDSPGTLRLEGWVEARAVVHERDSVAEAVEALALDVGETVRARVAAAVEEEAAEEEEEDGEIGDDSKRRSSVLLLSPPPLNSPVVVPLARRILFPLLPGGGGGSTAPAASVLGGDLALPPKRNDDKSGVNEGDRADGEGVLDAASQLCGRDDLTVEDLVFTEGRAEGASATAVAASSPSPSLSRQQQQQPRREAATTTTTTATAVPPIAAAGAVTVATLALALGVYLTLA